MSALDEIRKALSIADSGFHGLEIVGTIAKQIDPSSATLEEVLGFVSIVGSVFDAVSKGASGSVSTEEVKDSLTAFKTYMDSRRAVDKTELDDKFGGK